MWFTWRSMTSVALASEPSELDGSLRTSTALRSGAKGFLSSCASTAKNSYSCRLAAVRWSRARRWAVMSVSVVYQPTACPSASRTAALRTRCHSTAP